MCKLFDCANEYVRQSDWKDLALIKFCLAAIGVLIGLEVPKKHRDAACGLALGIFIASYVPLMGKFFRVVREQSKKA